MREPKLIKNLEGGIRDYEKIKKFMPKFDQQDHRRCLFICDQYVYGDNKHIWSIRTGDAEQLDSKKR